MKSTNAIKVSCLLAMTCLAMTGVSNAENPDGKPVKVYILSGQSNMVGAGKVTGGGGRWGLRAPALRQRFLGRAGLLA